MNFGCIKFCGPVLSQLLVYLISWSFQKIAKFKYVWLCVCMCMYVFACVCLCTYIWAYVYVCINDKWKQCYNYHMHNAILRIYLRNVTEFQKLISWKFKEFVSNIYDAYLYLLQFCYISSSIKMLYALKQSWKSIFIGIFF